MTNEFLDVSYPYVAGAFEIDALIDHKIDELIKQDFSSAAHSIEPSVGQIVVTFSQKVATELKKRSGWFGQVKEKSVAQTTAWECWTINVNCLPLSYKEHQTTKRSSTVNAAETLLKVSALSFENTLYEIYRIMDIHKDHIPPIMTLDVYPFPFDIAIDPKSTTALPPAADDDTWVQYIKKLMEQT